MATHGESPVFNDAFYANLYPDLAKNGLTTRDQLLRHWKLHGEKEGRACCARMMEDRIAVHIKRIHRDRDWETSLHKMRH